MMIRSLFIFLNMFIIMVFSKGTNTMQKIEKSWKSKKISCERTTCSMYNIEEGMNCVYKCLSPECYDLVYGKNPLEDGEIDTNCVRKEYKKIFTINKKKSRNVNDKKDELKKTEEETL